MISIDDACAVNVLKRTDSKGHYFIEPAVCFNGTAISQQYSRDRTRLTLSLDVASSSIKRKVRRQLSRERPSSVEFLPVTGADVHFSNSIVKRSFERLIMTENGVELQILCKKTQQCKLLSSPDLWRHVSFTVKSLINFNGKVCSWYSHKFAVYDPRKGSHIHGKSHLSDYHAVDDGLLCFNPVFVNKLTMQSIELCAILCKNNAKCQGFSKAGDLCQLYVFDKCSRNVRDCGCTRRGRVFVKKHAGLEPGHLCPTGYRNDRCGFKYMVYKILGNWESGKAKCESEKGLVTMSDVTDEAELSHLLSIKHTHDAMWLGGYQQRGSEEPAGGWKWAGCETPISRSLWNDGEPNNCDGVENVTDFGYHRNRLVDRSHNVSHHGFICKCVSPF